MSTVQQFNSLMDDLRVRSTRIDLETAARMSGYSSFHFHRLFKEHAGETLREFSSRTRLARAAQLLRSRPTQNVLQVGLECGFSSAEDFSRSFRRHFGLAPSEAARGAFVSLSGRARPRAAEVRWPVRVQRLPAFEVVYTRVFRALCSPEAVEQALRKTYDWSPGRIIGLSWDELDTSPAHKFTCDVGIMVNGQNPKRRLEPWMNRLLLPSRCYAVMDFRGDLDEEALAFDYLRHCWLPRHGFLPATGPSFEVFLDEASLADWNTMNLKLCIPVSR